MAVGARTSCKGVRQQRCRGAVLRAGTACACARARAVLGSWPQRQQHTSAPAEERADSDGYGIRESSNRELPGRAIIDTWSFGAGTQDRRRGQ